MSALTKKQVMPKNSSVADHLLFYNHSASYDDFSILMRENKKLLELKEILEQISPAVEPEIQDLTSQIHRLSDVWSLFCMDF